jgi:transposase
MPQVQFIAPIPGIQIDRADEVSLAVILKCSLLLATDLTCQHCASKRCRVKAYRVRELKHGFWNGKLILLHLRVPKLYCPGCGRYFMAPVPGVMPKRRATEQFRQEVFHLHQGGLTQKNLSLSHSISTATVERWYHDFVAKRVKELDRRNCPAVLGIDEHFFSRKNGYATTFVDLKNHKVFDVVLGRSEEALKAFLRRLDGRDRVRIVVMDLSETYRSIVRKYFPNAQIVADRFHVVRLLNQQFLKVWGGLDPEGKRNRGLLSLVRRHEWNLKPEQIPKMEKYFKECAGFESLYRFKQDLMRLLLKKHQKRVEAKALIPQLLWHMNELLMSPWEPLKTFGHTLQSWIEPIVRMWRFTKTNGITEGLHTKMEMISRRAFGFRNFKNYRLRVIALCGWDGVFTIRN